MICLLINMLSNFKRSKICKIWRRIWSLIGFLRLIANFRKSIKCFQRFLTNFFCNVLLPKSLLFTNSIFSPNLSTFFSGFHLFFEEFFHNFFFWILRFRHFSNVFSNCQQKNQNRSWKLFTVQFWKFYTNFGRF